jgi:hypothetical protein
LDVNKPVKVIMYLINRFPNHFLDIGNECLEPIPSEVFQAQIDGPLASQFWKASAAQTSAVDLGTIYIGLIQLA